MRLQLQLLKDGEGGPALTLEQAVAALMANKPDGTDGALLKVRLGAGGVGGWVGGGCVLVS